MISVIITSDPSRHAANVATLSFIDTYLPRRKGQVFQQSDGLTIAVDRLENQGDITREYLTISRK